MKNIRVFEHERNIGLIGVYYSGKTVFLTSLINHLMHHNSERFPLGNPDAVVRKFKQVENDVGWQPFDYQGSRDAMLHERMWPNKTTDRSQYVCKFERSDWRLSRIKVRFFDLPGERIADFAMARMDYAAWSEHIVYMLRSEKAYRDHAVEFINAVDNSASEGDVIRAYKLALGRLIHVYKPYISPSTFLLDTKGTHAEITTPQELANTRFSGLNTDSEFAPLTRSYRDLNPHVSLLFSKRYDQYKREVVMPLVKDLLACHSLLVMVDVTEILAGGTGMYNDTKQLIDDLLKLLDLGRKNFKGRLVDLVKNLVYRGKTAWKRPRSNSLTSGDPQVGGDLNFEISPARIKRIAFVAPKLDLVHPMDQHQMTRLLKEMTEGFGRDLDGVKADYFHCSAVVSTVVPDTTRRFLNMIDGWGADGREQSRQHEVSPLPDRWPDQWQPRLYTFPPAQPRWPERKDSPPKQMNLNTIFDFLIG